MSIAHEIAAISLDTQRRRLHALVRPFPASGLTGRKRTRLLWESFLMSSFANSLMGLRVVLLCDRALGARKDGYLPRYQAVTGWQWEHALMPSFARSVMGL